MSQNWAIQSTWIIAILNISSIGYFRSSLIFISSPPFSRLCGTLSFAGIGTYVPHAPLGYTQDFQILLFFKFCPVASLSRWRASVFSPTVAQWMQFQSYFPVMPLPNSITLSQLWSSILDWDHLQVPSMKYLSTRRTLIYKAASIIQTANHCLILSTSSTFSFQSSLPLSLFSILYCFGGEYRIWFPSFLCIANRKLILTFFLRFKVILAKLIL